jgi:hypothetical protein
MSNNFNRFVFILFIFCLFSITMAAESANPKVMIQTNLGDITLDLYMDKAPITTGNFLKYVRENRLQGAAFYRDTQISGNSTLLDGSITSTTLNSTF